MHDRLQHAACSGVWTAHAGMRIAITCAGRRHIHGKHQRFNPRRLRAFQRIAHETPVFQHIKLEPHRPVDGRCNLFNRTDRDGGKRERNAFFRRRACSLHFAASRVHTGQTDRCQHDGHRQFFAKQLCLKTEIGHVFEDALTQGDVGQIGGITSECMLVVSAAVDVMKQEWRQFTFCRGAVVR
ncbi:hypothetical protein SRABI106_02233 [Rahnella aquatilis]|nr:hypothetical protein SRABI106_02233 [Rahnella aquatilis]